MKKHNKIWKYKLEEFIIDLYFEQRKNCKEIAEIITKEKGIQISSEPIRNFLNQEFLHDKTPKNTL